MKDCDTQNDARDYWVETNIRYKDINGVKERLSDALIHVHYGKGYIVDENLNTVCIGEYPPPDVPQTAPDTLPESGKEVLQHDTNGIVPAQPQQAEVLQHKNRGGRPRGGTSRTTKWRREKEKQLEMAI